MGQKPQAESTTRIDLHVHGQWSADAIGDLDALARAAKQNGLHGIALTEHNTRRHHDAIHHWNRSHGDDSFRFYPGIEISTRQGHILAIGNLPGIPKRLPLEETLEKVHDAGGVAIPAHPHRPFTGIGPRCMKQIASRLYAVEVHNAQETPRSNERTQQIARRHALGGTGGSDAHQVHDVANAYTVFSEPIGGLDDLLDAVQRGETHGEGGRTRWVTRTRQRLRIAARLATGKYP